MMHRSFVETLSQDFENVVRIDICGDIARASVNMDECKCEEGDLYDVLFASFVRYRVALLQ